MQDFAELPVCDVECAARERTAGGASPLEVAMATAQP
jgi:hypothetical protein